MACSWGGYSLLENLHVVVHERDRTSGVCTHTEVQCLPVEESMAHTHTRTRGKIYSLSSFIWHMAIGEQVKGRRGRAGVTPAAGWANCAGKRCKSCGSPSSA